MILYICEKPSQGKAYAEALGIPTHGFNGYYKQGDVYITWCVGHLLQPLDPQEYDDVYKKWSLDTLPILPKEKWKFKANQKTKSQLVIIKKLLEQADTVYIASDADREGDFIVISLLEQYNFNGERKRVWTGALDKVSINKAIAKAKDASKTGNTNSWNGYLSASTRQKADWIYGMNLTRAMTVANRAMTEQSTVLSVGRVQSAVLYLIVSRDLEIENFKSINYYGMSCVFQNDDNYQLKTNWTVPNSFLDEKEEKCIDKSLIQNVIDKINGKNATVIKSEKNRKKEDAPLLFSLSALQKEADAKLNIGAAETLQIAQSLYENHKATTYPRTDSQYVNNEQFSLSANVLKLMKESDPSISKLVDDANVSLKSKVWDDKKVEAHHAIIPNNVKFDYSKLTEKEKKIYDLIRLRYIAQFYPKAESDHTVLELDCEGEIFKTSGKIPILAGWKTVIGGMSKKDNSDELPLLDKGSILKNANPKLETKLTKPPTRFTEGDLIDAMLNAAKYVDDKDSKKILKGTEGIGTEATRATIIETLFKRDYIKKEKKNVLSTEKGRMLIEYVPKKAKSVELTAFWESQLNLIEKGELTPDLFLNEQEIVLNELIDEIKSGKCTFKEAVGSLYTCEKCNSGLTKIKSKKNGKNYWVCRNEECKTILADNRGKPAYPKNVDQGTTEHICSICKNHKLIRRVSPSNVYYWICEDDSCLIPSTGKKLYLQDEKGEPISQGDKEHLCIKCNKGRLIRKLSQKGSYYWQCPCEDCKTFYEDDNLEPKLIIKEDVDQGTEKHTCFKCNKTVLVRKKGQYGMYWNCASCKINFKDNDGKPVKPPEPTKKQKSDYKCPNCKNGYLIIRNGKNGEFYGCNDFPKCKTLANKTESGKPEGF